MADIQKTVQIIFSGKNEIGEAINQMGRDFDKIGSNITGATGPLDEITDKVLGLQAAFAALALGGIAYAVKSAGEFNGQFGEISTLIQDTGAPIAAFKREILDYSADSVKSIGDINKAVYAAISAGVDYSKSVAFVSAAEKLSVAGRSALGDTTKILISTLNAYGQSTDQAEKYSDILFTTVRLGQTTMGELSSSLAMITGLASTAGIPFETLSAAIAALTVYGLPTSQAITGLRQAIQNIIQPSGEAEKMAKTLGIQFNATALQTKGFEGVLNDAYRAANGNIAKMGQLFGSVESLNVVMMLGADKTGKFKDGLIEMGTAAGATQTGYNKVVQEFENVNQRLFNSFKVTVIELGEKLLPQYGNIAGALGDLMKGIRIGIDAGAFDPLYKNLDEVGKRIADTIRAIAKNLPEAMKDIDFSGLLKSLDGLGGSVAQAFKSIFGDIDLTTPEGLHKAIQRIVDSLAALTNITKGVINGMDPLFKLIGTGIDKFSKLDESAAGLIGTLLGVAKSINILADYSAVLTSVLTILSGKALLDVTLGVAKLGSTAISVMPGLVAFIAGVSALGVGATIGVAGAATALTLMTGALLNQVPAVQQGAQGLLGLIDVNKDFFGTLGLTKQEMDATNLKYDEAVLRHKELASGTGKTTTATDAYSEAMKKLDLSRAQQAFDDLNASLKKSRDDLEAAAKIKELDITVKVLTDGTSIETTKNMIYKTFPDGQVLITNIGTVADQARLAETKKKIDDAVPTSKVMEIQATIDVAKIKEASEIVQKSIEWKAKINIAQIEASATIIKATFASIDNTVTSTGTTISSMLGSYEQALGRGGTSFIENQIVAEGRRRDDALKLQKDMTGAQVDLIKQQTESLKAGNAMIQIDGKGLQPHLEAFMFEILAAIQVKANQEGMKFLVGV